MFIGPARHRRLGGLGGVEPGAGPARRARWRRAVNPMWDQTSLGRAPKQWEACAVAGSIQRGSTNHDVIVSSLG